MRCRKRCSRHPAFRAPQRARERERDDPDRSRVRLPVAVPVFAFVRVEDAGLFLRAVEGRDFDVGDACRVSDAAFRLAVRPEPALAAWREINLLKLLF